MSKEFGIDWQEMDSDRAMAMMEVMVALDKKATKKNGIDGRESFR